ncbi:MAG TPA: toll/interleukin-1 receptor domain-containing protein [Candidatus Angelobacter sp.]|jgi:hypothetical protein|nr:toll/interleukin-1 receptor domain-containing protein [Candidatus Angelobacter sp.]
MSDITIDVRAAGTDIRESLKLSDQMPAQQLIALIRDRLRLPAVGANKHPLLYELSLHRPGRASVFLLGGHATLAAYSVPTGSFLEIGSAVKTRFDDDHGSIPVASPRPHLGVGENSSSPTLQVTIVHPGFHARREIQISRDSEAAAVIDQIVQRFELPQRAAGGASLSYHFEVSKGLHARRRLAGFEHLAAISADEDLWLVAEDSEITVVKEELRQSPGEELFELRHKERLEAILDDMKGGYLVSPENLWQAITNGQREPQKLVDELYEMLYQRRQSGDCFKVSATNGNTRLQERTKTHVLIHEFFQLIWQRHHPPEPNPAGRRMPALSIVVCHSDCDKTRVESLYEKLKRDGFTPWYPLPGSRRREIRTKIRTCNVVLICLSSISVREAGELHSLIHFAVEEASKQPDEFIFLIPVRFDNARIPENLQEWNCADLFEKDGYGKLVLALETVQSKFMNMRFDRNDEARQRA